MMMIIFLSLAFNVGRRQNGFCITLRHQLMRGCLYKYIDIREEETKACMITKIWIQKVPGLRSEWAQWHTYRRLETRCLTNSNTSSATPHESSYPLPPRPYA